MPEKKMFVIYNIRWEGLLTLSVKYQNKLLLKFIKQQNKN